MLLKVVPDLKDIEEHGKSQVKGFMDLNLDILGPAERGTRIALSHYYKHSSGDMIPDPDMEFMVNFEDEWIEPLTYQDSTRYQEVYFNDFTRFDPGLRKSLHEFCFMWFSNLYEQGHRILKD